MIVFFFFCVLHGVRLSSCFSFDTTECGWNLVLADVGHPDLIPALVGPLSLNPYFVQAEIKLCTFPIRWIIIHKIDV
jgi:hypothetical protein